MVNVNAQIQSEHYATAIKAEHNTLIADEYESNGGGGKGFTPSELLAASLAACTAITCRMYADRKTWPLEAADVNVSIETINGVATFHRTITFQGALDAEQKMRLTDIANKCPIHKLLNNSIEITTTVL